MDISIGSDHHSTVEENVDGGVDPSLIRALPEFEFELGEKGSVNCAICLSEFECKEVVKKIPFCGHVFHPKCIEMWLLDHPSCPLCRSAKLFIPQPVHHTFNGLALLKGWLRLS
ncbi:hypothetical protein Scep_005291 [Stephania cephalantha]|uniref:RING-type E3 ubiquitin transferase n=1 Tax=Stephania cephalantha TaxID=152367 RepID=A0AAP0KVR6_9MAGN